MAINTQSFTTMVQNAVAAMQGAASALIDLTVGSILRAFVDAYCGLALWLQGIALQVASLTRFATSNGADADSWGADYGFDRLQSLAAVGTVTLSRFTPTAAATIPAAISSGVGSNGQTIWTGGSVVQTQDGSQQFQVIPDVSQAAYNAGLNAYVINSGVSSGDATVQANTAGAASNVGVGLISLLGSAIPGVDTVTNAAAFTDGADAEIDQAFKARFPLYLESLTQGTKTACENAVRDLQQGATCSITENFNLSGVAQPGYFYAVVDDGTGDPPDSFLLAATAAIDAVRAEGTTFSVVRPTVVTANIALTVAIAAGFTGAAVRSAVSAAISAYVNTLSEGATLPYNIISSLAFSVSGVINVSAILLNGGAADLVSSGQQLIRTGTVTVS